MNLQSSRRLPLESKKTKNRTDFIFVGIDQTGAVDRLRRPRPLPACVIADQYVSFHYLASFSSQELVRITDNWPRQLTLTCVDCVFGLPRDLPMNWREALVHIKKSPSYGRESAQNFFRKIGKGHMLKRKIEIAIGANSVFQEKPFQKNIQTGSYRIWKDISQESESFFLPALEKKKYKNSLTLVEGYPSYSWKLIFDVSRREPSKLATLIKKKKINVRWSVQHQKAVLRDPNLADAFLLALTAQKFYPTIKDLKPNQEGWILGQS